MPNILQTALRVYSVVSKEHKDFCICIENHFYRFENRSAKRFSFTVYINSSFWDLKVCSTTHP